MKAVKPKPLVGVTFVTDTYFDKPALRFGDGKQTCQVTVNNAKRLLQAGADAVVAALCELVAKLDPKWEPATTSVKKPKTAKIAVVTKPKKVKKPVIEQPLQDGHDIQPSNPDFAWPHDD